MTGRRVLCRLELSSDRTEGFTRGDWSSEKLASNDAQVTNEVFGVVLLSAFEVFLLGGLSFFSFFFFFFFFIM